MIKQLVVISGKGGTGKTVITGAFAALAKNKVMADCDVDAADLHLLLNPVIKEHYEFRSGKTAFIDKSKCIQCNKCAQACRFSAIANDLIIDPVSCEGCAFCSYICPVGAIEMRENISGEWFISDTRFGAMVHAKLGVAEENSGKLVSLVRTKAKDLAQAEECDWVIIDGAPGIGCPVIASLSGIGLAVVVTEPTLSGLHDAKRVIEVTDHFNVSSGVVINKFNLNLDMSEQIEEYCRGNNIQLLGKVSFDKSVVQAMVNGKTIIEYSDSNVKREIVDIWKNIQRQESLSDR
ncbi:MAG: P-loop NTPase [Candidatus Omnitrophota bacterium]